MTTISLDGEKLQQLHDEVGKHSQKTPYDDVLHAVRERAKTNGFLTKLDLGALIAWKRIRANAKWVNTLMMTPDREIAEITGRVYAVANGSGSLVERAADSRKILLGLPGAGPSSTNAFASAVLTALNEDMPVYDTRALTALERLGIGGRKSVRPYSQYVALVEQIRIAGGFVSNREVDLGLYWLGG